MIVCMSLSPRPETLTSRIASGPSSRTSRGRAAIACAVSSAGMMPSLRASQAGASGLLLVDLPPEHCAPLRAPAAAHGLDWIGLVAPTTTPQRRAAVLANASGFIYAVSLTGVTGTALDPNDARLHQHLAELRASSELPVVVGFGVRTADDVRALARSADGVVVGSALVEAGQRGTGALGALVRDLRAATLRQA